MKENLNMIIFLDLKLRKYIKKKKRKYGYIYEDHHDINKERGSMSFLFFHWRYFLIFLGLKLRNKSFNFKNRYITKIKK